MNNQSKPTRRFQFSLAALLVITVAVVAALIGFNFGRDMGYRVGAKKRKLEMPYSKVYSVADLFSRKDGTSFVPGESDFQSLGRIIEGSISPDTWMVAGGMAHFEILPKTQILVVVQTSDVHEEIENLLALLRAAPLPTMLNEVAHPNDAYTNDSSISSRKSTLLSEGSELSVASGSTATEDLVPTKTSVELEIDGVWNVTEAIVSGQPMETDVARSISLTLADSNYRVVLAGKVDNGTYTLDRTTAPNRMTIIGTEGPSAGKTMLAIFDMPDSQTMRICYDLQGINFPESFESASGSNLFFVTYSKQR